MNILFIASETNASGIQPDFMSDSVLHGLRSLYDSSVIDYQRISYMYKSMDKSTLTRFHGHGFTLAATLDDLPIDRTDIVNKIKNHYFDIIIYGAVYRCLDLLNIVTKYYNKNEIIFIDGDDNTAISYKLLDFGIYFKRELSNSNNLGYPQILPLTFGFPEEKICTGTLNKSKTLAYTIPGVLSTYKFNNEESYYKDYQDSYYGLTWKKAGWDCLRHYEILANGCIPLFLDIKNCPELTLFNFPKKELLESFDTFDIKLNLNHKFEYDNRNTIINFDFNILQKIKIHDDLYNKNLEKLYTYLCNNLTTKMVAEYILKEIKK